MPHGEDEEEDEGEEEEEEGEEGDSSSFSSSSSDDPDSDAVTSPAYNFVELSARGSYALPFGLNRENALLLRGMRGGVIVLDMGGQQIYKPVGGRLAGEDFVCETLNVLWSLGDRAGPLADGKKKGGERHLCRGFTNLRAHVGAHKFVKRDVLRLYLRHRLKLRIVIGRSKVRLTDSPFYIYIYIYISTSSSQSLSHVYIHCFYICIHIFLLLLLLYSTHRHWRLYGLNVSTPSIFPTPGQPRSRKSANGR